jgi:aspartyl/asparaginyl-tRNA synthetase
VKFHGTVKKMRRFFEDKGFVEVHTQNRLSILAACEDPTTIATYGYEGQLWPMPQTGQMWLEHELLKNPKLPGLFCLSTSYRNEPNPVPGRHDRIFPMFEFEMHGGLRDMVELESELCADLGFPQFQSAEHEDNLIQTKDGYPKERYEILAKRFGVEELDHDHEASLCKEYGPVYFITDFPEFTSPFWNMARNDDGTSKKVDVIIAGQETIGSAERSTDKEQMRHRFHTISDGDYAKTLYAGFTKERVEAELEQFLKFDFFPRSGGGIGVTRMIKGLEEYGLLEEEKETPQRIWASEMDGSGWR